MTIILTYTILLIGSISLDEAIPKVEIDATKVLKKRRIMIKMKILLQILKRRSKRERERILSHPKIKNIPSPHPKGKTQPKSSSTDKFVTVEEQIHDDAIQADQPVDFKEDVVNVAGEQP
nr:hypothetical protein [Tanacetum cinerariifolium]